VESPHIHLTEALTQLYASLIECSSEREIAHVMCDGLVSRGFTLGAWMWLPRDIHANSTSVHVGESLPADVASLLCESGSGSEILKRLPIGHSPVPLNELLPELNAESTSRWLGYTLGYSGRCMGVLLVCPVKQNVETIGLLVHSITASLDRLDSRERLLPASNTASESSAHLHLIDTVLDTIPSPVFYQDTDGVYLGCNKAYADCILGFPSSEIIGNTIADHGHAIPVNIAEIHRAGDEALYQNPGVHTYNCPALHADGEVHQYEFSKATFCDSTGDVAGIVGVMTDISKQTASVEAVRRKQVELRFLYESAVRLGGMRTPADLFEIVPLLVSKITDYDGLILSSYDPGTDLITADLVIQMGQEIDVSILPPIPLAPEGTGCQSSVIRSGTPMLIRDWIAVRDKRVTSYYISDESELVNGDPDEDVDQVRSGVVLPLKVEGRVVGAVQVHSRRYASYTEDDMNVLGTLFNHVAAAISNIRLYEKLQRSELLHRSYIDSAPEAVVVTDGEGRLVQVNKAAEVISGRGEQDLLQITVTEILDSQESRHHTEFRREILTNGCAISEFHCVRPDGTGYDISCNAVRISDERFLLFCQDITEAKRAREALAESERRYELAMAAANDGLWDWNVITDKIYFSPRYFTMLGYEPYELPPEYQTWVDLLHPDDRDTAVTSLREAIRSRSVSYVSEFRMKRKSGEWCWILDRGEVVEWDDTGKPMRMVGTHADITSRKQFEQTLATERDLLEQRVSERTADLTHANTLLARAARLKDEFLANMSHELRTPLNVILSVSEALQEQAFGTLNARQTRFVKSVEQSGRHLLSLINDILDLSKVEAGKLAMNVGPVNMRIVCDASLQFVRQAAAAKGLHLDRQIDIPSDEIEADEQRLTQILVNLLSNAVKFTPSGGAIGIDIRSWDDDTKMRVSVWDTGIGISAEDIPRLFTPFGQLDSGLARQHEGTGLGLSLVKRLTEMHGGSVWVESEEGKGSTFTLELPWKRPTGMVACPDPVVGVPASSDTPMQGGKGRALLAEDNDASALLLTEYLTSRGFEVIRAHDGIEAVDIVDKQLPDVVLMDIHMPRMNGLDAIRKLRNEPYSKDLPIIAITGLAMPGDRDRCIEAGANEYLSKPVRLSELHDLLIRLLSGQKND
jgi:PAS domain S-box-containing protein